MLIPDPIPSSGITVPLRAAFTGIKGVPLLGIAHNNASPKLVLFEDRLLSRVIFERNIPLPGIEFVSILEGLGTRNVEIVFRKSIFTFSGNLRDERWLRDILLYFSRKDVALSEQGREYLRAHGSNAI